MWVQQVHMNPQLHIKTLIIISSKIILTKDSIISSKKRKLILTILKTVKEKGYSISKCSLISCVSLAYVSIILLSHIIRN